MQIDPITAALGSTAASTTSVNGVNNFESYLNNAGNNSLASIFQKAADTYGVSVSLLTAMAKQESNFQANATSKSGAMGIMQLMPSTASYFGCTDPYDPEQNIMAGAKYISELLNKYNGDTSLALAAYNAGSGNVAKYGGIPPFKETQNYVAKIPPVAHQISMMMAHIRANSSVVFRPLKWPCTRTLASIMHTLKSQAE